MQKSHNVFTVISFRKKMMKQPQGRYRLPSQWSWSNLMINKKLLLSRKWRTCWREWILFR